MSTGAAAAAVTGAQGGGYLVSTLMAALRGALATVGLGVRSVDAVKHPPTSTAIANSRLPWCNEHPESGASVHVLGSSVVERALHDAADFSESPAVLVATDAMTRARLEEAAAVARGKDGARSHI